MLKRKYLNPQNDFAFKRIFGKEKNKDILITLLNEVLKNQLFRKIVDLSFLKPVQEPEIASKKQSVVDVFCTDEDDCKYIIKMQVANTHEGFKEQAQYNAYKAFVSQMNKGYDYNNLKKVIFLAFTSFDLFPSKKEYKSEYAILDKKTKERNLNKISFTFVDLAKFNTQNKKPLEDLTLEEKFYYFFHHGGNIESENLKKLIGEDTILKKAYQELDFFYLTDNEKMLYEAEEKRERQ